MLIEGTEVCNLDDRTAFAMSDPERFRTVVIHTPDQSTSIALSTMSRSFCRDAKAAPNALLSYRSDEMRRHDDVLPVNREQGMKARRPAAKRTYSDQRHDDAGLQVGQKICLDVEEEWDFARSVVSYSGVRRIASELALAIAP